MLGARLMRYRKVKGGWGWNGRYPLSDGEGKEVDRWGAWKTEMHT